MVDSFALPGGRNDRLCSRRHFGGKLIKIGAIARSLRVMPSCGRCKPRRLPGARNRARRRWFTVNEDDIILPADPRDRDIEATFLAQHPQPGGPRLRSPAYTSSPGRPRFNENKYFFIDRMRYVEPGGWEAC